MWKHLWLPKTHVAQRPPAVLPGKKNAPKSGLLHPSWYDASALYGVLVPFVQIDEFGELFSARIAWITNAVELGSDAWFGAAM